jgi:hypothetical protein
MDAYCWVSGVIASSTCLIFDPMPNACWLSLPVVFCRLIALAPRGSLRVAVMPSRTVSTAFGLI